MENQAMNYGKVALGAVTGLAVGMAATYAMSGDAVLLRRNLRKLERSAQHTLHEMEKHLR